MKGKTNLVLKSHVQNAPRNMFARPQEYLRKEQQNISDRAERNTTAAYHHHNVGYQIDFEHVEIIT